MNNEFYYGYEGNMATMGDWVAQFVLIIFGAVILIASLIGLTLFVIKAIGLYAIAKRRGIRHAWLSWIPVGRDWIVGCISDQYQYVVKAQVKNRRMILMLLSLASKILNGLAALGILSSYVAMVAFMLGVGHTPSVFPGLLSGLLAMLGSAAAIVFTVFYYISICDLYTSCNPKNSVLYLILGIFFRFTEPFFIFSCRNKDEGMPPRKVEMPIVESPFTPETEFEADIEA